MLNTKLEAEVGTRESLSEVRLEAKLQTEGLKRTDFDACEARGKDSLQGFISGANPKLDETLTAKLKAEG